MLELFSIFLTNFKTDQIDNERIDHSTRSNRRSLNDESKKKHSKSSLACEMKINQLTNLIRFTILSLLFSRCCCSDGNPFMLPIFEFFQICSGGLRATITDVDKFNDSSGVRIIIRDQTNSQHYQINIVYFNHDLLPQFDILPMGIIPKNDGISKNETHIHTVKYQYQLGDFQQKTIFFKDFFFFFPASNTNYVLGGYANELIGCPQVLCMNAYLDASFFHVKEKMFYFFRGPYYYSIRKDSISADFKFNLIGTKFFFVPMYIDSATYFETRQYPSGYVILFSKEDRIYVHVKERGSAIEISQKNFFSTTETAYIDLMMNIEEDILLIKVKRSFVRYVSVKSVKSNEIKFTQIQNIFSMYTNGSLSMEEADDAVILKDKDEILFFYKFKVYITKMNEFIKQIRNPANNKKEVVIENFQDTLFFDYFGSACQPLYPGALNIEPKEFKETYLEILPRDHAQRDWNRLVTSSAVYDLNLTYITIGMIFSFLIVAYMVLFIFLVFFCTSTSRPDQYSSSRFSKENSMLDSQMERETLLSQKLPTTKKSRFLSFARFSNLGRAKSPQHEYKTIKLDDKQDETAKKEKQKDVKKSESEYIPFAFSDYNPISSKLNSETAKPQPKEDKSMTLKKKHSKRYIF